MYKILIALILMVVAPSAYSQPLKEIPVSMKIQTAEESLAKGDYYSALDWFEQAYKEKRDPEIAYKIALLHLTLRDYARAETQLSRLLTTNLRGVRPPAEAYFYYGQVLKMNGKTREATEAFQKYMAEGKDQNKISMAQVELDGIKMMDDLNPNKGIAVVNVGTLVNSPFTESSALQAEDGSLYFISFQKKAPIVQDGKDNDYFSKIYTSTKDKDGKWAKPTALPDAINRPNTHSGHVSLSPDGKSMVFTRAVLVNNEVSETRLYASSKTASGWTPAQEVKTPTGDFQIRYPAFGRMFDREVLFFSSNMPGTKGGYDIFYAHFDGETLGDIINMGPAFNSEGDEISPFYTRTKFYYSSNGLPGMGGFDIFSSEWTGTEFAAPVNMGRNFNTSVDDMFFTLNPDGNTGFLVSNRPGTRSLKSKTCCDDIFYFSLQPILVDLTVTVFETPKKALPGSQVILNEFVEESSIEKERKSDKGNTYPFELEADKAYRFITSKEGYYPDTFDINTVGIMESSSLKREVILRPMPPEPTTEVITINEPIRLNNIYYDYDDAAILKDAEQDLSALLGLLQEYPTMVIELSSHTDARGNDEYNKRLSQRRANSAKNWITARGIDASRIKAIGFGEAKILNHCKNGVNCTDDEHRFNRRTEFRILEGPQTITIKKEIFKGQKPADKQGGGEASSSIRNMKAVYPKGTPVLKWDNPFHDFGVVQKGMEAVHEFGFTNTGDADLIIEMATAYECTRLEYPTRPVKPGERGAVKAIFYSPDKSGETEITINIVANTNPVIAESRFRAFVKE